jgi:transposase InsO family protein
MKQITDYFGITRQAYYKAEKTNELRLLSERACLSLVQTIRRKQPKIGCKKLYYLLYDDLMNLPYKISRDKLFTLLRDNDMLVKRKRRYVQTTNSNSANPIYSNLLKTVKVTKPNEALAADITYIRHSNGFAYLSLVCDLYSRKITGFHVSDNLSLDGPLEALKMSIKSISPEELKGMIHHSDRGCQYRSIEYTEFLKKDGCQISMSRKGNPYDNAIMERINGILKDEFLLNETYGDIKSITRAVKEAIKTYNEERPHLSLSYKTPFFVYYNGTANQVACG